MQILLWNVGYLVGDRGSFGGYLPSPREAFLGDGPGERHATERLVDLVSEYCPDAICLVEVDGGSFRTVTDGQVDHILEKLRRRGLEYTGRTFTKYDPRGVLSQLPFFRHLGNAVLLPEAVPITPRYLSTGMKRLVIDAVLPSGVSLFLTHLSVRAESRRRQLRELAEMVNRHAGDGGVIVAGDLNTYRGRPELDGFVRTTGLRPCVTGPTVPERPFDDLIMSSRALDLFLSSPDLAIHRTDVLPGGISDHHPVLLETADEAHAT